MANVQDNCNKASAEFDFDALFDAEWPANDTAGGQDQMLALDFGLDGLAGFPDFRS
ncbi:hypothetical protein AURDEDRAFT_172520, partial [Auricularia subglabra TFB-10046 SS5]